MVDTMQAIQISEAQDADFEGIWQIFHKVVQAGDTYNYDPNSSREDVRSIWLEKYERTFVAKIGDEVLGTYSMRTNHPCLGAHVANAGYMVHPDHHGKGLGKSLCLHSMDSAKKLGYKALQFNYVVSTNSVAVALWKKLGFKIIGTIPKGFKHLELGYVDVYIMHQELSSN